jgi:Methyltransferase domain
MQTLQELLEKNCHYSVPLTGHRPTDKELRHQYASRLYDRIPQPLKNNRGTVLEIGVCHGGSLLLWRDYFTEAKIMGVDKSRQTVTEFQNLERIQCHWQDAYSREFVKTLPTDLTLVIDDGPHTERSQELAIDLYRPRITSGGLLIIEDIKDWATGLRLQKRLGLDTSQLWDLREGWPDDERPEDNIVLTVNC